LKQQVLSAFTIAALVICALSACGQPFGEPQSGKLSVVSTIFPSYDFARQITGGLAEVTLLLPPGSESHTFEPTPRDIAKIQSCGLFIHGGGESDAWAEKILGSIDTTRMKIVTLLGCVEPLEAEHHHDGDEHDTEAHAMDEHVWTSPRNAKRIVEEILRALCEADAENAPVYLENARAYLERLDALDMAFQAVVDKAARKTLIFGDRFPFRYFAQAYGLECFAAFPGCAEETEASAATVKRLIDKVNAEGIPVVFHLELSDRKMAQTIARATGAQIRLLHACHNISKDDFLAGKGYIDLMEANVQALQAALE